MPNSLFRYRVVIYLPVILLVLVACIQVFLVYSYNLSPWSGGGFGMFSTTDAGGNRHLHLYSVTSGIRRGLNPDPKLDKEHDILLALPIDYNFNKFTEKIAKTDIPDEGQKTLQIQIWKRSFDPETLEPSTILISYKEVPIGE